MADPLELQGMDTLMGVLSRVKTNGVSAAHALGMKVMLNVFTESQHQCPVDSGTLKGSGHLESEVDAGLSEIVIGYGGAAAGYALWVHENLSAHHRPPTKAKFLEDPMNERVTLLQTMAQGKDFESALLGQYPQSPAIAHGAEMASETSKGYNGVSLARRKGAVAKATPFSSDDIAGALARASAHPGRMVRK